MYIVPARRGDLEILGYCLLLWASGNLPWIKQTDKLLVAEAKKRCVRGDRNVMSITSLSFLIFLVTMEMSLV